MNAVARFATLLAPESLRRLAARGTARRSFDLDVELARLRVLERWAADLCGLLNSLTRGELVVIARGEQLAIDGRPEDLRLRLWQRGAALERGGVEIGPAVQPQPVILGGHLVIQAPPRGLYPPSPSWPRPIPPAIEAGPSTGEPETLDELIDVRIA